MAIALSSWFLTWVVTPTANTSMPARCICRLGIFTLSYDGPLITVIRTLFRRLRLKSAPTASCKAFPVRLDPRVYRILLIARFSRRGFVYQLSPNCIRADEPYTITPTRARLREIENDRETSSTNFFIRLKLLCPTLPEASKTKPISIARLQAGGNKNGSFEARTIDRKHNLQW